MKTIRNSVLMIILIALAVAGCKKETKETATEINNKDELLRKKTSLLHGISH